MGPGNCIRWGHDPPREWAIFSHCVTSAVYAAKKLITASLQLMKLMRSSQLAGVILSFLRARFWLSLILLVVDVIHCQSYKTAICEQMVLMKLSTGGNLYLLMSFIVKIEQEARLLQKHYTMRYIVNLCYVSRGRGARKISNSKSDLKVHLRPLAMLPFDRPHTISY